MPSWSALLVRLRSVRIESRDLPLAASLGALALLALLFAIHQIFLIFPNAHVLLQPPGNERGLRNATVTIVEFASLDCHDCLRFEEQIFPKLMYAYIDSGRVRFVFKSVAPDALALSAAALARCARQDDFFAFVDLMLRQRARWANAPDPEKGLVQLAEATGMPPDRARDCLADSNVLQPIDQTTREARSLYATTDSFVLVIDGRPYRGALTWPNVSNAVDEALARHQMMTRRLP